MNCTRECCANRATPGVVDGDGNGYCIACGVIVNREAESMVVHGIERARATRREEKRRRRRWSRS